MDIAVRSFRSLNLRFPLLFPHVALLIRSGHILTAALSLFLIKLLTPLYYGTIREACLVWMMMGCGIWLGIQFLSARPWRLAWRSDSSIDTASLIYRERVIQHASYFICVVAFPGLLALATQATAIPAFIYVTISCVTLLATTPLLTWPEEAYVEVASDLKGWPVVPRHSMAAVVAMYGVSNVLLGALLAVLAPLQTIHFPTAMDHFLAAQFVWLLIITVGFLRMRRTEGAVMNLIRLAVKGDLPNADSTRIGASYPLYRAMLHMLDRMRHNITRLQHYSSEMHAGSQLMVDVSKEQNQSIVTQSSSARQTSATLETMVQSSVEIADKTSTVVSMADDTEKRSAEGLKNMTESVRHLSGVREKNQTALSDIIQLSETMREIEQVLELVTSIADDTNLIALNAAIEASSAGEHGKRFKIVAQEVRDLSDRVNQAIAKTRSLIENIHGSTQRLVATSIENVEQTDLAYNSAETTYRLLQDISSWAKRSAEAARQIYVAIQHQRLSNQQISGSFQEIASQINSLAATSQRYREYAQTLRKFSTGIEEVLRQYRPSPDSDGFL